MAGAGYKLFNTGDVLTAAQVNTYLQEQTVMVFASSTARTTALSGVLAEGMMSYLQDTNAVEVYNGTSWVNVGNAGDITEVQAGVGISIASGTGPIPVITNSSTDLITTAGDLLYGTAADTMARLGIGTAGQVLQVNSGATAPQWATPAAGGGGMTLLNSGGTTLSGSSTVISSLSTSYNDLYIVVEGFRPASDGSDLYVALNNDTTANRHFWGQPAFTDRTNTAFDNTGIRVTPATDNTATNSVAVIYIPNYADTSSWKFVLCYAISNNNTTTTNFNWQSTQGAYNQTAAIDSLRFFPGTSTMSAGTVYVYGVK